MIANILIFFKKNSFLFLSASFLKDFPNNYIPYPYVQHHFFPQELETIQL